MIRKIILTNFMAHASTEIRLADGLTVLVGPNNIGKSTVALALKILARNTNSTFVMQHEQKECSIAVETSEGHSIEWIKKKSPSYRINGQAKDRLGRGGTPPELDLTLRLAPVEFEDKDFEPHFGDQKNPIFLINRPASQIAQFFSTTSDAEKLVAMQRLHHRNRTETQTQSKLLAAKNETIQLSLNALEEIPKLQAEWESLEREALSLESLAKEIAKLERLVESYAHVTLERQFELLRTTCLQRLSPLPTIHPTEHLMAVAVTWESTLETLESSHVCTQLLSELVAAPKMADEYPLANTTRDLTLACAKLDYCEACMLAHADLRAPSPWMPTDQLQLWIERFSSLQIEQARLEEISDSTKSLADSPALVPDGELVHAVHKIAQSTSDHKRLKELLAILNSLKTTPVFGETNSLTDAILAWEKSNGQFDQNRSLLEQVHQEVIALESDAANWLSTEPTCDTCGGKLSADSVRFKSHRHGK